MILCYGHVLHSNYNHRTVRWHAKLCIMPKSFQMVLRSISSRYVRKKKQIEESGRVGRVNPKEKKNGADRIIPAGSSLENRLLHAMTHEHRADTYTELELNMADNMISRSTLHRTATSRQVEQGKKPSRMRSDSRVPGSRQRLKSRRP